MARHSVLRFLQCYPAARFRAIQIHLHFRLKPVPEFPPLLILLFQTRKNQCLLRQIHPGLYPIHSVLSGTIQLIRYLLLSTGFLLRLAAVRRSMFPAVLLSYILPCKGVFISPADFYYRTF